jgi:SOS-response transcriptional repressor LexA
MWLTPAMQSNVLKTKETSERVRTLVEAALKAKGISGRQASLQIVGHDGLIRDIRAGRLPSIDKLEALFDLLGLEFYFGTVRDIGEGPPPPDPADFAQVPLHEAALAAGSGAENGTERVVDYLAFRRDWLRKIGVAPSNAVLARAWGDSMQPCIWDGDMVLIDRARADVPVRVPGSVARSRSPIYAVLDEGRARLKRIERPEDGQVILLSDNPDYPPEFARIESLSIIGKVLWWGHTNRD